jgi:hypothetical protein
VYCACFSSKALIRYTLAEKVQFFPRLVIGKKDHVLTDIGSDLFIVIKAGGGSNPRDTVLGYRLQRTGSTLKFSLVHKSSFYDLFSLWTFFTLLEHIGLFRVSEDHLKRVKVVQMYYINTGEYFDMSFPKGEPCRAYNTITYLTRLYHGIILFKCRPIPGQRVYDVQLVSNNNNKYFTYSNRRDLRLSPKIFITFTPERDLVTVRFSSGFSIFLRRKSYQRGKIVHIGHPHHRPPGSQDKDCRTFVNELHRGLTYICWRPVLAIAHFFITKRHDFVEVAFHYSVVDRHARRKGKYLRMHATLACKGDLITYIDSSMSNGMEIVNKVNVYAA